MGATPQELRAAALALPETEERDHFGAPSFRVGGKIFAQIAVRERRRAILKLPVARRDLLFEVRPEVFIRGAWGRMVVCYVALDEIEPDELEELVQASWAEVAPRRLAAAHPFLAARRLIG